MTGKYLTGNSMDYLFKFTDCLYDSVNVVDLMRQSFTGSANIINKQR